VCAFFAPPPFFLKISWTSLIFNWLWTGWGGWESVRTPVFRLSISPSELDHIKLIFKINFLSSHTIRILPYVSPPGNLCVAMRSNKFICCLMGVT
jgi:hypothetical protein